MFTYTSRLLPRQHKLVPDVSTRVAGGKTPSRGKTPTHDIRGTGRNPVKCLLTISVGEWPEFVYIFGATRQS